MVDTSLFGRLKRLFSTDVIIRNVGGNQLKVLDTVNIQATGVVQTNMYPERYQRIYTGGMGTYVGNAPYSNFTIIRPQLYNDYEVMDGDPIIASVLDIVADESTLKNGAGEILSIKSSDENIQRILYNLFYDVLNIEFNLWGWIRSMCKYGDFYLHMHVAEKYGIYQVIPLNVYNVIREEGLDPKNPAYVRFKVEPNASYMSVTTAGGRNDEYFDNYEIANFRLLGDYNFLPYGRCADFMSRIHTEKGVKELQHIIPGDKVWTYNIEENKYELANVLNVVNSGTKKLFKISTVHNEIKVTDNHPMLVWSFDEEKPVYRQTKDLNKGDYLCLPKKIDFPFQNPKLNKTLSIKETKRNQFLVDSSSLKTFPDVVTPDFARFWGFMLGDGWENPTNNTIGFARGINDDRNKIYEDLLKKYSGKEKLNELHNKKSNVNPSGVSVNSTVFHDLMTINGYVGKSYSKRFPSWIYECDEETQLSLVKGLMDADGYLSTDKWGCTSYNITLNNKEMLKDLKTLLDRIKIKTGKIRSRKFTGKCIVNDVEYKARQSYDFTFYLDGKRKQQYEKYNVINPDYNVELFKIQSIVEELPDITYDIQVDRNFNFIADGFIVHNSYIEPARKIYKQLTMMEDAMLIHRILRAPQRRVYYVDTGGIPPNEIPAYMEKLKSQTSRTPYVDPKSGEYNLRYNMMNVNEDFYVPTRGDKSGTKIDTLPGLEYNAIEDVIYLRDKMLAAVKVPKAFLGYEADVEGKCIDPLTKIPLLDGRTITVAELIEEHNNGIKNYVYSLDTETNNIVPGEIEWAGMTRLNTQTVKVWLDNGEYIRCTPDHKFLTRDGIYKDAQDLKENEALMPLYLRKSDDKKINGYDEVYNPSTGKYEFTHRLVANHYGLKTPGSVIHHFDCNKLNNNPENLDCSMNFWQHREWHVKHTDLCHTDKANAKRKETHRKLMFDPEYAAMRREVCKENSKSLVEWIRENGASRKGFIKVKEAKCKGCGITIDKTILSVDERRSMFCSKECRKANWSHKSNSLDINKLIEYASKCTNFQQLMDAVGFKDHATLRKTISYNGFSSPEFILAYMPLAHTNARFMNQFPETNEYYLNTYKPEQKEWKEKYSYKNHKVAKVEWCDDLIDTCDITIKDYHNFGTAAGVIIHNSTLAQQDIRFARTIERIQRIVVSELTKMALVHLYAQGYNDESLTNFELELTTPSIIYEQEKIALMKEKVDLAKNMMDINLFPTDHIYDYLFHMSEDKYDDLRDLMIEDKKRIFRLSQIENEGNDPVLSGESYGTPHDLASLYGKGRNGMGELPSIAYDEKNPVGRPVEKTSVYNTQKRIIGKDPLGKGLDLGPDTPNAPVPKGGPSLALEGTKSIYVQSKKMLNEMKNKLSAFGGESLLDESNIKGID